MALWALVMTLRPDVGFSAPWPWMGLFWALQIAVGLIVLQLTLERMNRFDHSGRIPLGLMVLASGFVGVVILSPLYWLIGEGFMQHWMGFPASLDDDLEYSHPPQSLGLIVLLHEMSDIVGPVIAAWFFISWPRLQGLLPPLVKRSAVMLPPAEETTGQSSSPVTRDDASLPWRSALPKELGDDLIAVKSELQYLRVWTARGSALVLGSLQEVEDSEGDSGMRVHRSWWVNVRHVRCVRRRGDGAVCELSDGREIPVSRRRKSDALARFGDGVRFVTPPSQPSP